MIRVALAAAAALLAAFAAGFLIGAAFEVAGYLEWRDQR